MVQQSQHSAIFPRLLLLVLWPEVDEEKHNNLV